MINYDNPKSATYNVICVESTVKQVIKVIRHKAALPLQMEGSIVCTRWRQCTP